MLCCKREESPCQLGAVHTWHLATFAVLQYSWSLLDNNAHTSILARDGYDVNDPISVFILNVIDLKFEQSR